MLKKSTSLGSLNNDRGVTYLFLMFTIVVIGIAMTASARQWKGIVQRELEADLLAKGIEIQNALAQYSSTMKAGRVMPGEIYPQSLADLTRLPKPFLRKVYVDPVTHGEWDYLRGPNGGIMGVRSKSVAEPFKQREFPLAVRHFDNRKTYRDWIFQHPNPSTVSLVPPAGAPAQPQSNQPPSAPNQGVAQPASTANPSAPAAPTAPAAPAAPSGPVVP
ncbi:MAG TPA: hypothetical protein VJ746_19260 [Nitrospira sp.]|nr:hypothetical protein [Nitrospira sp.]